MLCRNRGLRGSPGSGTRQPEVSPFVSSTYKVYNLGQVTQLFCASEFPHLKEDGMSTYSIESLWGFNEEQTQSTQKNVWHTVNINLLLSQNKSLMEIFIEWISTGAIAWIPGVIFCLCAYRGVHKCVTWIKRSLQLGTVPSQGCYYRPQRCWECLPLCDGESSQLQLVWFWSCGVYRASIVYHDPVWRRRKVSLDSKTVDFQMLFLYLWVCVFSLSVVSDCCL